MVAVTPRRGTTHAPAAPDVGSPRVTELPAGATLDGVRRLWGAWVRTDPEGSGSFDGLGRNVPLARLKPNAGSAAGGARGGAGGRGARGGGRGGNYGNADGTPH